MTNQNDFVTIFNNIPKELKENLEKHFKEIILNYRENRWEPSELNGAKFSEVVFRILEWYTNEDHFYTAFGNKIEPFNDKLRQFENKSKFPNTIRFHIPKMLTVIYSLRNDRGVGHVGGDINPNHMDSVTVLYMTKWIMAELIRIFHIIPLSEAQEIIETIIEKEIPIVWNVLGKKRVLDPTLKYEIKTLLLLYSEYPKSVNEKDLIDWTEHSNPTIYRVSVLDILHKQKFIEYDKGNSIVLLSPKGVKFVEENVDLTM